MPETGLALVVFLEVVLAQACFFGGPAQEFLVVKCYAEVSGERFGQGMSAAAERTSDCDYIFFRHLGHIGFGFLSSTLP